MLGYLDHLLGSRWTYDQDYEPGFIRNGRHEIAWAALITPIAIDMLAVLVVNRKKLIPGIQCGARKLTACFVRTAAETPTQGRKRIVSNIVLTSMGSSALAASAVGIACLIDKGLIAKGESFAVEHLSHIAEARAVQKCVSTLSSKAAVYTGYSLIGVSHSVQAVRQYKASKIRLSKHAIAALIAFITPVIMAVGIYETRWHHMSYGQLCLLPSLNAVNFFGGMMVLDSMLYWLKPMKDNYDFSNIFVTHLTAFLVQMTALSIFQLVSQRLFDSFTDDNEQAQVEELPLLHHTDAL